jgi:hypothetical protein
VERVNLSVKDLCGTYIVLKSKEKRKNGGERVLTLEECRQELQKAVIKYNSRKHSYFGGLKCPEEVFNSLKNGIESTSDEDFAKNFYDKVLKLQTTKLKVTQYKNLPTRK